MRNRGLALPAQTSFGYGHELAYQLACEKLAALVHIEEQCRRTAAEYRSQGSSATIVLKYLNQPYQVTVPDIVISKVDSQEEVPLTDKILILHYLTQGKGTPFSNNLIAYKELPDGSGYFPSFHKRAIHPLVDNFGKEPHQLLDVAATLGAHRGNLGDISVTIDAFSRVPITLVLWRGDDEFLPEGNILFDSTISDYLTTEDINVLCSTVVWKLVKLAKAKGW